MTLMCGFHIGDRVTFQRSPYDHREPGRVVGVSVKAVDVEDEAGRRVNNAERVQLEEVK